MSFFEKHQKSVFLVLIVILILAIVICASIQVSEPPQELTTTQDNIIFNNVNSIKDNNVIMK